ncbi:MAG: glucosyl-3-phosphoglycerate synthase [Elusimicrobia bacterium]|nr:glucosyl-3-phosphoglycerate synthase [Elusimicrobiota bacterium]
MKTFDGKKFPRDIGKLKGKKKISVIIPVKNEEKTIGKTVQILREKLLEKGLIDEIVVIDGNSQDRTREFAEKQGAKVYVDKNILPQIGNFSGKGNAIYKSYFVTTGDIMSFVDGDIFNFSEKFVTNTFIPIFLNEKTKYVKAFYTRPLLRGKKIKKGEGGRVTEILARPLLNTFFPCLCSIKQPLSGEYSITRQCFRKLSLASGYGVEISFLLEILLHFGPKAFAQVDCGMRIHKNQSLHSLGRMGFEVLQAFLHHSSKHGIISVREKFDEYYDAISGKKQKISQFFFPPVEKIAKRTEFILLRHGETNWNKELRIQSRNDIPLNQKGISEANKIAKKLKKEIITAIYTSPLRRARQTAQIIAKEFGIEPIVDERLVEINHGKWAGQREKDILKREPEKFKRWKKTPWEVIPEGGETWKDFRKRVASFFNEVFWKRKGERILIVSHKGAIAVSGCILEKKPLKELLKYDVENCQFKKIKI